MTATYHGQPVTYSLKIGKAFAYVSTVEGFSRMAITCQSPSMPLTKVPDLVTSPITIKSQETTTCTWYFKPKVAPGTVSLSVWRCPDGFVLADYETMLVTCTVPVDGIWVRMNDNAGKDFDYDGETGAEGGGTIEFTAVIPDSYYLYLWPGSFDPPPGANTTMLGSCTPDVYTSLSVASPKVGWFSVPAGGAIACYVYIIPAAP